MAIGFGWRPDPCPAAQRGLCPRDFITEVKRKLVTTLNQFREAMQSASQYGVLLSLISARDGAPEFRILKDTGGD